ncbi:hypothetical protein D3248_01745 [Leucobacter zeae]|nr:hypothetical protein [Leucobacter zeae]
MDGHKLTRTAALSLELHRATLPYLSTDWPAVQRIVRANLDLMLRRPRAEIARGWIREWEEALERGPEALAAVAMTPGERGDDLRQMTPLAGVLPQDVRLDVIQRVRGHAAA